MQLKNKIINARIIDNNRVFLILLTLLFVAVNPSIAQKSKKKKSKLWSMEFRLASTYDSNILKYSDKYLQRFMNYEDEGRFTIKTYDDISLSPGMSISTTRKIFGKNNTKFSGKLYQNLYLNNNIKNWSTFGLIVQQYLPKKIWIKIAYNHIPEFYVRNFRDDDWVEVFGYIPQTFKPYSFSKDNYSLSIQKSFFKATWVNLSFQLNEYFHNRHYIEYDSKNLLYGLKITQPITKTFRLSAGYQYTSSVAKGFDEEGETIETSDDGDASYVEDRFTLGLRWTLPKIFKKSNYLTVESRFQNLYYSTDNYLENDPIHAGRVDKNIRVYLNYNVRMNKAFRITAFYNSLYRDSTTEAVQNEQYLSDEKDYKQYQTGLRITYNFKI